MLHFLPYLAHQQPELRIRHTRTKSLKTEPGPLRAVGIQNKLGTHLSRPGVVKVARH